MKKIDLLTVFLFLALIAALSTGSMLKEDRDFSPNENRYLAKLPQLSMDGILNGEFQEDFETYLNDQFLGRDSWITVKTALQSACGDTDIGGAYLGKNGYDFEKITEDDVDQELFEKNLTSVSDYFAACSDVISPARLSFMLVPTAGLVMEEHLPANAPLFHQSAYIDTVAERMGDYNFIDLRQTLGEHSNEEIYYRTDHHWTTKGAYLGYAEWCRHTGRVPYEEDAYTITAVSEDFRGSLYSKILNYDSAYDKITNYTRTGSSAVFTVLEDGKEAQGFYEPEKLSEKDQYAYFFGGNYGEMVITRKDRAANETEEQNLLVVKDSFANAFLPFIAEEYDHIYVIDLRYFSGEVSSYMEENRITDVLILYNISNFISDKNIYKLTK